MDVVLGQQMRLAPHKLDMLAEQEAMDCVVVYIHPKKRFFVAEFTVGDGSWRESYWMVDKSRLASTIQAEAGYRRNWKPVGGVISG